MRELAEGYVRAITEDDQRLVCCTATTVTKIGRLCWPEDEVPEVCFAPEPPQFREGDWVLYTLAEDGLEPQREYFHVVSPDPEHPRHVRARGADGILHLFGPRMLTLEHRCPPCLPAGRSRPTGPPVVGSYVGLGPSRGVVGKIDPSKPWTVHVRWPDGSYGWYRESELVHLCSPEDQA